MSSQQQAEAAHLSRLQAFYSNEKQALQTMNCFDDPQNEQTSWVLQTYAAMVDWTLVNLEAGNPTHELRYTFASDLFAYIQQGRPMGMKMGAQIQVAQRAEERTERVCCAVATQTEYSSIGKRDAETQTARTSNGKRKKEDSRGKSSVAKMSHTPAAQVPGMRQQRTNSIVRPLLHLGESEVYDPKEDTKRVTKDTYIQRWTAAKRDRDILLNLVIDLYQEINIQGTPHVAVEVAHRQSPTMPTAHRALAHDSPPQTSPPQTAESENPQAISTVGNAPGLMAEDFLTSTVTPGQSPGKETNASARNQNTEDSLAVSQNGQFDLSSTILKIRDEANQIASILLKTGAYDVASALSDKELQSRVAGTEAQIQVENAIQQWITMLEQDANKLFAVATKDALTIYVQKGELQNLLWVQVSEEMHSPESMELLDATDSDAASPDEDVSGEEDSDYAVGEYDDESAEESDDERDVDFVSRPSGQRQIHEASRNAAAQLQSTIKSDTTSVDTRLHVNNGPSIACATTARLPDKREPDVRAEQLQVATVMAELGARDEESAVPLDILQDALRACFPTKRLGGRGNALLKLLMGNPLVVSVNAPKTASAFYTTL